MEFLGVRLVGALGVVGHRLEVPARGRVVRCERGVCLLCEFENFCVGCAERGTDFIGAPGSSRGAHLCDTPTGHSTQLLAQCRQV